MKISFIISIALLMLACQVINGQGLPKFNVIFNQTSVSGLSAGGFMAIQMHVAFSSNMIGIGVISAGPYLCSQGILGTATSACMSSPVLINLDGLVTEAKSFAKSGLIDPLTNLQGQNIYFYHGTVDTVVVTGVVQKAISFYTSFNLTKSPKTILNIASQHGWITNNFGNPCKTLGEPYFLNCNYEAANDIFSTIYGNVNPAVTQVSSNLFQFNQSYYFGSQKISMGPVGYYYVPTACQSGTQCRIHIALHGCEQTLADVQTDFVVHTGLNELAEANNVIVLYPQIQRSNLVPYNPKGCFDWWGYTETVPTEMIWATQKGKQMQAIWKMVQDLAGVTGANTDNVEIIDLQ